MTLFVLVTLYTFLQLISARNWNDSRVRLRLCALFTIESPLHIEARIPEPSLFCKFLKRKERLITAHVICEKSFGNWYLRPEPGALATGILRNTRYEVVIPSAAEESNKMSLRGLQSRPWQAPVNCHSCESRNLPPFTN